MREAVFKQDSQDEQEKGGGSESEPTWTSVFQNSLEKLLHGGLAGVCKKLSSSGALEHAAIGNECDAVGRATGEAHLVGDENDGFAGFTEFHNHIENFGGHLGIEGGCGFVEEEKSRIHSERAGYGNTLPLATAELCRLLGRVIGEVKAF